MWDAKRSLRSLLLPVVAIVLAGPEAEGAGPLDPVLRAHQRTAGQSTAEVVADLGEFFTKANTCGRNTHHALSDLEGWALTIPCNVKVRRLIEDGRRDGDGVARLLRDGLEEAGRSYAMKSDAREGRLGRYRSGEVGHPGISEDDAHYARHREYEDPVFELDRVHYVFYAGLYVLANIDRLDTRTLASWLGRDKPMAVACPKMDAWLVHVRASAKDARGAAWARAAAKGTAAGLTVRKRQVPRWTSIAHGPAAEAAAERIEVLDIPTDLKMDDAAATRLVQDFLSLAKSE